MMSTDSATEKINFGEAVDVRDGLNPSIRKALITLNKTYTGEKFCKSIRLTEQVATEIGCDADSVYDVMVDLEYYHCEFPYINGHGNFGFPPAAPEFSEMKPSEYGKVLLGRANETDFSEPFTVPIPFPLACGTVGYCRSETKIPTHNLAEVIDAMIALVKNPELKTKDLLEFIKGPDILPGGVIENPEELPAIYEKGFGTIKVLLTRGEEDRVYDDGYEHEDYFYDGLKSYCLWYGIKCRKLYRQEVYRLELPYFAYMYNGETYELMSLEKIMKVQLAYYRAYQNEWDDEELCEVLEALKANASKRKTENDTDALSDRNS